MIVIIDEQVEKLCFSEFMLWKNFKLWPKIIYHFQDNYFQHGLKKMLSTSVGLLSLNSISSNPYIVYRMNYTLRGKTVLAGNLRCSYQCISFVIFNSRVWSRKDPMCTLSRSFGKRKKICIYLYQEQRCLFINLSLFSVPQSITFKIVHRSLCFIFKEFITVWNVLFLCPTIL